MAPWIPATPTPTEPNTDGSYRVLDSATDTSRAVFEKVNRTPDSESSHTAAAAAGEIREKK